MYKATHRLRLFFSGIICLPKNADFLQSSELGNVWKSFDVASQLLLDPRPIYLEIQLNPSEWSQEGVQCFENSIHELPVLNLIPSWFS